MGAFFASVLLAIMFMLWASGRSPLVRFIGEMAGTAFYLLLSLGQAWNQRADDSALVWKILPIVLVLGAAANAYRFMKDRRKGDVSPPSGPARS
jgi:hypothetical protein